MRAIPSFLGIWVLLTGLAPAGPVFASEPPASAARVASLRHGVLDPDGIPTLAPFAHVVFCKSEPGDCRRDRGPDTIALTPELTRQLQTVNLRVNRAIRPVEDGGGPLGDVWRIAPSKGDCDDYAVTKRHELMEQGLPASALRLLVVQTAGGEGHMVLAVRTDRGEMVLDNLTDRVLDWQNTRLRLVKYQSGTDPQRWLRPGSNKLASAGGR